MVTEHRNVGVLPLLHVLFILSFIDLSECRVSPIKELSNAAERLPARSELVLDVWFCPGLSREPHLLFASQEIAVNLTSDYDIYKAPNYTHLLSEYEQNQQFFGIFRRVVVWQSKQLSPFRDTYVGVETLLPYAIRLKVRHFDALRFILFAAGVCLFLSAHRVARHTVFYYSAGCSIGVVASMLVLLYIVSRAMPKRSFASFVLWGGGSFSLYLIYMIWNNLHDIFVQYHKWVAVYLITVTLLSFAVCYRVGPPSNERSLNLCQWTLQAIAVLFIYSGCQIEEMSLFCIAVLLIYNLIPVEFWRELKRLRYRYFPKKQKFINETEYIQQGAVETEKALRELREYCQSPGCNAWKTVSKLKSPMRFASFVAGESHLADSELMDYDEYSFNVDNESDTDSVMTDEYDQMQPASSGKYIESLNRTTGQIPAMSNGVPTHSRMPRLSMGAAKSTTTTKRRSSGDRSPQRVVADKVKNRYTQLMRTNSNRSTGSSRPSISNVSPQRRRSSRRL